MKVRGRIIRYLLEVLAIGSVLLIPAGCDPALLTLPSELADVNEPAGDDSADDGAEDDGSSAGDGDDSADSPGGDAGDDGVGGAEPEDQDSGPDGDSPGDADSSDPPADDGDGDAPPGDSGDDDSLPDDGDGDPPPDDDDPPGDNSGDDDPPADDGEPEVPSNAYCNAVADWPDAWRAFEEEVLALVNEQRAAGATCGSYGSFGPAEPLTFDHGQRCAARAHSMDMGERDFFSHTNPDGEGPGARLEYAGYSGFGWGENIAWGYASPAAVVAGWMSSAGHCANIMRAEWTVTGVGYYEGNIWTQTFGAN